MFNTRNMRLSYIVEQSQLCLRKNALANFIHLRVCQFSVVVAQSVFVASMFFRRVSIIVSDSSYAQMLWIYTRRIIASVHNNLTCRNFANEELVGISVCTNSSFAWHKKNAIAIMIFASLPNPASIGFQDFPLKNVPWTQKWKIIEISFFLFSFVARSAQLSSYGFLIAAQNTFEMAFRLIRHFVSPYENAIICHNHGGGKCL